jgi:hypothetical protein
LVAQYEETENELASLLSKKYAQRKDELPSLYDQWKTNHFTLLIESSRISKLDDRKAFDKDVVTFQALKNKNEEQLISLQKEKVPDMHELGKIPVSIL